MSSLSMRYSVIISPMHLHLLNNDNVSSYNAKFGMCVSFSLLQHNIITLLMKLSYLLSCSITYSEHTHNHINKPIDEGIMSTISSANINDQLPINLLCIKHNVTLFIFTEIIVVNTKKDKEFLLDGAIIKSIARLWKVGAILILISFFLR